MPVTLPDRIILPSLHGTQEACQWQQRWGIEFSPCLLGHSEGFPDDRRDTLHPLVATSILLPLKLRDLLRHEGHPIGRRLVATLMKRMGVTAIYRTPRTSLQHPAHRSYPYLLRELTIIRPNHVWAADITYIPMRRGFVYLCAILDWATRRVLAWRLSNTLTTDFCLEAVQEAVTRYGSPAIFNTDQGCQFTRQEFTSFLKDQGIQISMDGIGRWRDNVFVERLWRSLKYEAVYLHASETVRDAQEGVARYMTFYNESRPHRALDGRTPDRVYWDTQLARHTAA